MQHILPISKTLAAQDIGSKFTLSESEIGPLIDQFDTFGDYKRLSEDNITEQPIIFMLSGNRRKFSEVDDVHLLYGLRESGSLRDLESIRDNWLPRKKIQEIKHRIKNLTCSRAPYNVIRRWKQEYNQPLR